MRTLFLNTRSGGRLRLRRAVIGVVGLACLAAVVLAVRSLLGRPPDADEWIGMVLAVGLVFLVALWLFKRRVRSDSRSLQGSALW
jgi:Na+/melibiose symporter-like transporter